MYSAADGKRRTILVVESSPSFDCCIRRKRMKNVLKLSLVALLMLSTAAVAQDETKKKGGADQSKRMVATLLKGLEPAALTVEQKQKIEELYTKVAKEVSAKRKEVKMPANIVKKRADATKEAKEAGKKGKALEAAVAEKLALTKEQADCWQETSEMLAKAKIAVGKMLTEEQLAKIENPLKNAITGKTGGKGKKQATDA